MSLAARGWICMTTWLRHPRTGQGRQKQLRQRLRRPSDQRIRKRMEAIIISGTIWRLIISEDDINSTWAIWLGYVWQEFQFVRAGKSCELHFLQATEAGSCESRTRPWENMNNSVLLEELLLFCKFLKFHYHLQRYQKLTSILEQLRGIWNFCCSQCCYAKAVNEFCLRFDGDGCILPEGDCKRAKHII